MADSEHSGVGARLLETIKAAVRERHLPVLESESPLSAMQVAASSISQTVERWRQAGGVTRFFSGGGRDRVVALGGTAEFRLTFGAIDRMRAKRAQLFVGGVAQEHVPMLPSQEAFCHFEATQPGVFQVESRALGANGEELLAAGRTPVGVAQVLARKPTAFLDAEALVAGAAELPGAVRLLHNAGFQVCYFDLAEKDRSSLIHERLVAEGLPDAAVVVHPVAEAGFRTLGVDFRAVFGSTTLRRLRAEGAPVTLVVLHAAAPNVAIPGVHATTYGELLSDAGAEILDGAAEAASAFCQDFKNIGNQTRWRLRCMTGVNLEYGNRVRVELDNARARARLFELLERANHWIHLQTYIFRDDVFCEQVAARLVAAGRRGVSVRLLVDALYSAQDVLGVSNTILDGLRKVDNVTVVARDAISSTSQLEARALKHRDHRKLLSVDGEVAWISGRNLGAEYFTGFSEVAVTDWTPSDRVPWFDAHAEVTGPLVGQVERAFAEAWTSEVREPLPGAVERPTAGSSEAALVLHDGIGDASSLGAYEALIAGAQERIIVVNDFPVVDILATALRKAVARGVRTTMLIGSAVARRGDGEMLRGPLHRQLFEYMTKRRFETLLDAGVELVEFVAPKSPTIVCSGGAVRPYVHGKLIVTDGRYLSVGSANLDATASYWEREANLVVDDPEVAGPLERQLQAFIDASEPIDRSSPGWKREATQRELASRLWPDSLYS